MTQKNLQPAKSYTRKKIQNFSYGLNDAIGKGYSSQVYRGRNDNSDQPVAVKVIDLKMLKCEINRTLLASQIQILKSMKNVPYVLTLHEVYTTKNNTYIITELCETDLSSKIKKSISENDAITYMEQIIQGYSYIFEKNLIHRDLKPANLLITKTNQIKIADFGFGVKAEEVLKPSKYNVGSPLYMAPESLRRNQYSFKTDIWALGIILFEMLTGDTPWRAKNEKQLLKKIQGQKIDDILARQKFTPQAKQFLSKALNQDKIQRLGPEQLLTFSFKTQDYGSILGERHLNTVSKKFQSIGHESSPKKMNYIGKSIQKRIFTNERSDKKLQPKIINSTQQNMSLKNIENLHKNHYQDTPSTSVPTEQAMTKEDKKIVSKLLIAEVHFCRFLYKLYGRIKESIGSGLFKENMRTNSLFKCFTSIIETKVSKLKQLEKQNYLQIQAHKFDEYRKTSDYKKLIKIAKDYYERYSSQLSQFWQNSPSKAKTGDSIYKLTIDQVSKSIEYLLTGLEQKNGDEFNGDNKKFIDSCSKDIIILDYLITCKQLLEMIEREIRANGQENYQKFAKKSRIQEIVEGSTSEINAQLYEKIVERGRMVIGKRQFQF